MVEELAEIARMADFTERLRAYRTSLAHALSFIIWASVMIGLPLAHVAIMFSPWFPALRPYHPAAFMATVAVAIALSLLIMGYLQARLGVAHLPNEKLAHAIWPLAFSIPFAMIYGLIGALELWGLMPIAWCLSGGVAYLLVGLTIERWLVRERLLFARPFTLMGVLAIAISVPVFYLASLGQPCAYVIEGAVMWSWVAGPLSAMLLASALYILASFATSLYALLMAERAVFGP